MPRALVYPTGLIFAVILHIALAGCATTQTGSGTASGQRIGHIVGVMLDDNKSPVIMRVIPGSPAEESGLRAGDAIIAVDGRRTDRIATVPWEISRHPAGTILKLTIQRGDATFVRDVPVGYSVDSLLNVAFTQGHTAVVDQLIDVGKPVSPYMPLLDRAARVHHVKGVDTYEFDLGHPTADGDLYAVAVKHSNHRVQARTLGVYVKSTGAAAADSLRWITPAFRDALAKYHALPQADRRSREFIELIKQLDDLRSITPVSEHELIDWLGPPDRVLDGNNEHDNAYFYDRSGKLDGAAVISIRDGIIENVGYNAAAADRDAPWRMYRPGQ